MRKKPTKRKRCKLAVAHWVRFYKKRTRLHDVRGTNLNATEFMQ